MRAKSEVVQAHNLELKVLGGGCLDSSTCDSVAVSLIVGDCLKININSRIVLIITVILFSSEVLSVA